jgi:hypothetical protein
VSAPRHPPVLVPTANPTYICHSGRRGQTLNDRKCELIFAHFLHKKLAALRMAKYARGRPKVETSLMNHWSGLAAHGATVTPLRYPDSPPPGPPRTQRGSAGSRSAASDRPVTATPLASSGRGSQHDGSR